MVGKHTASPERYERGTRSYTMSHIRGKDTTIEVLVRSYLFRRGLRFRKNDKRYPGHPDVVLPKYHAIVFVNGCFWHMHEGCSKHAMPKSNVEFWSTKLLRNHDRDVRQHAELRAAGWRVIVVWECELAKAVRDERLARLYDEIVASTTADGTVDARGDVQGDAQIVTQDAAQDDDAQDDAQNVVQDEFARETGKTAAIDARNTRIGNGNERRTRGAAPRGDEPA